MCMDSMNVTHAFLFAPEDVRNYVVILLDTVFIQYSSLPHLPLHTLLSRYAYMCASVESFMPHT